MATATLIKDNDELGLPYRFRGSFSQSDLVGGAFSCAAFREGTAG